MEVAQRGVYPDEKVTPVPAHLRCRYLMRGKDAQKGLHRIVPELREKITFCRLNFMDKDFRIGAPADVIFCRNVVIYLDRETQIGLFRRFYRHLRPGGLLFVGHSETLNGINNQFRQISPTIYGR